MILRVDKEKGYIDLSKRRVDPEDASAKEESFAKAKAVHGIMRHVAQTNNIEVEDLCQKVSWPLYKKYPDAFEAFKKHINEEINMWEDVDWTQPGADLSDMADKIKEDIETNLRRRLITQLLRLRAQIEVSCSEYEGIDAVREALMKGLTASSEDCEGKINLIAHPVFVLTCTCRDKTLGISALDTCMERVKECIEAKGGTFAIRSKPELIGQDEKHDEESGSESGSSDGEEQQGIDQEAMTGLDEAELAELAKKKVDDDGEDDDEDDKGKDA